MLLLSRRTAKALALGTAAFAGSHANHEVVAGALAVVSHKVLVRAKQRAREVSRDVYDAEPSEPPKRDDRLARIASAAIATRFLELIAEPETTRAEAFEALGSKFEMIASTESWRAVNDETLRIARRDGTEFVVWWALADACEKCWELHGERYPVDDIPETPPLHCRCRCSLIPD